LGDKFTAEGAGEGVNLSTCAFLNRAGVGPHFLNKLARMHSESEIHSKRFDNSGFRIAMYLLTNIGRHPA